GKGKRSNQPPPAPVVAGGGYPPPGGAPPPYGAPPYGGGGGGYPPQGGGGPYGAAPVLPSDAHALAYAGAPAPPPAIPAWQLAPTPPVPGTPPPSPRGGGGHPLASAGGAPVEVRCPACNMMTLAVSGQASVCFSCGQPLPKDLITSVMSK